MSELDLESNTELNEDGDESRFNNLIGDEDMASALDTASAADSCEGEEQ
jgi:hypothetical protein